MSDWTPAEYDRMDDHKPYTVIKAGARYLVTGHLSARVLAGKDGEIREGHDPS